MMSLGLCCVLLLVVAGVVSGGGHGQDHQNQGYFQYANVPAHGQYEFGYNRGNPSHYTSRYEQAHNWRFRTKVRWGDKHGGYGEHYWDYNHVDKGDKGHKGWKAQEPSHGHQQPSTGWGHPEPSKGWGHEQPKGWGHEQPKGWSHPEPSKGWGHQQASYSEDAPTAIVPTKPIEPSHQQKYTNHHQIPHNHQQIHPNHRY